MANQEVLLLQPVANLGAEGEAVEIAESALEIHRMDEWLIEISKRKIAD